MPSTAWNVFVASGVAIVVYFAAEMGEMLLGLAAGTILFLGGWLTGYAINRDLLDSMGLLRLSVSGAVSTFVVFWTVVVVEGEYLTGLLVVGLVWFAAWFTSDMGPIKGETGAMATIDEPRPPEGRRPGTSVDLGGESTQDAASDGTSVLGALRDLVTPSAPEAPDESTSSGPERGSADEPSDHAPRESTGETSDGPTYSTRTVSQDEAASGEKESIFGLGIFYEGDPNGPTPAGAEADTASTATEPIDGDHTRPGVSDGGPAEVAEGSDADAGRPSSTDGADATQTDSTDEADDETDDPPEEHRVDVDEGGFIFD